MGANEDGKALHFMIDRRCGGTCTNMVGGFRRRLSISAVSLVFALVRCDDGSSEQATTGDADIPDDAAQTVEESLPRPPECRAPPIMAECGHLLPEEAFSETRFLGTPGWAEQTSDGAFVMLSTRGTACGNRDIHSCHPCPQYRMDSFTIPQTSLQPAATSTNTGYDAIWSLPCDGTGGGGSSGQSAYDVVIDELTEDCITGRFAKYEGGEQFFVALRCSEAAGRGEASY